MCFLQELQNCNSLLNKQNVGSHQKYTQHLRAKEKPQQDCKKDKITFRIKLRTCQRPLEGSNKTLCKPGPRDPTETEPDLTLSVISPTIEPTGDDTQSGEHLCERSFCAVMKVLGHTTGFLTCSGDPAEGLKTAGNLTLEFGYWPSTGLGKQTLGGYKSKVWMHQDPGERSSDSRRD